MCKRECRFLAEREAIAIFICIYFRTMPRTYEDGARANNSTPISTSAHETSVIPERGVLKPTPEKYCAYCGSKMERQRYGKRLEDLSAFIRRKYCCRDCMRKAFVCKDSSNQSWKSAHATARKLIHLIEQREVVCAQCGSTENVDIHHIDGVAQNNNSDNLILLCRSCHMKAHRSEVKLCSVCGKECKRTHHSMCEKHYQQWKRNGDPLHKPWSTYKEKKSKGPINVYDKQGKLIKTYADVRTASKESGYARSSVTTACNTPGKTLGGYIWKYAD